MSSEQPSSLCFWISCDLLQTLLKSLANVAISTHLYFHPSRGIYAQVLDQHQRLFGEFALHPSCLELTEHVNEDPNVAPLDIPIYFEGLLDFISYLQKSFTVKFWPVLRCLQALEIDREIATGCYTYSVQEDVVYIPAQIVEVFPPVNLQNYPFAVTISCAEFSRQIEQALIDSECIQIAMCGRFLIFYTESDGRAQTIIPCKRLTADNRICRQGMQDVGVAAASTDTNNPSNQLVHLDGIPEPCLIQLHSLRYLSLMCKARHSTDTVMVGMSEHFGLAVVFPLRGYGLSRLNNKGVLDEESYFRYRLYPDPNAKRPLLPLFETAKAHLTRKFKADFH